MTTLEEKKELNNKFGGIKSPNGKAIFEAAKKGDLASVEHLVVKMGVPPGLHVSVFLLLSGGDQSSAAVMVLILCILLSFCRI